MSSKHVALVLVSHSASLASGVAELAAAMAPDVTIETAGGLPDGKLGTSFEATEEAVNAALSASGGNGVAVITDLGSATLTVDTVLEFADDPEHLRFAPGPLVEGAVAAAVAAQQGGDLGAVVDAVQEAAAQWQDAIGESSRGSGRDATETGGGGSLLGGADNQEHVFEATVVDSDGLHARPASRLATLASEYDAEVFVNGASAQSMMEIMALGVRQGDNVEVTATGPDADSAAQQVAQAISAGFDPNNE